MRLGAPLALAALWAALPGGGALATEADQAAQACREMLDRTLVAMNAGPPLKEELATGLMWLRLDATKALEAGDAETCLGLARRAAALLQVD